MAGRVAALRRHTPDPKEQQMLGITKRSGTALDFGLELHAPPVARPGHVVLDVLGAGLCGTDLHIVRNEYRSEPPVILGHEVVGRVAVVGDGVSADLIGQRFVAETFFSTCGTCRYCRTGRPNLCGERRSIGSHVNGAMTRQVALPATNLHPVPEDLPDAAAALAEPLACICNSLYGAEGARIEAGQRVLILGPGAIGLIAAQVARAMGGDVTLRGTPRDAHRLALARSMGFATQTLDDRPPENDFPVVVECSGAPPAVAAGLVALEKGGRFLHMGLSGREATVPMDLICLKEITVQSGFASTPAAWARAMRLLAGRSIDLGALVSDVIPLSAWSRTFDAAFAGDGVKFVFDPRQDGA
jgi:L-iditol 2-dehydrogenase